MITLTGYIDVPEDRLVAVSDALQTHISLTRAEPGCLAFDVSPDANVAGRFNVSERFVDRPSFDAHQTRTKASPWAKITEGIPRHYTIEDTSE